MIYPLTIAYMTCRKEPQFDWFFDSLGKQLLELDMMVRVVVVDYHSDSRTQLHFSTFSRVIQAGGYFVWTRPKPSVWQGGHRLTKEDWFAASNARNTALCYATDGWICYADDLSVLVPGWLQSVREAMASGYIALGAYKKVRDLVVENGEIKSFTEFPGGLDSRWNYGGERGSVSANGGMLYGCSVVMPVEALLEINGWPEDLCDGLSSEDYCCGIALQNAGYPFRYDRRMLTLESEEHHHIEPAFRRDDWHFENGLPVRGGNGGGDKSHAALNIAKQSKYFPNSFGEGGIRALRQRILSGEPFPIPASPDREWFTGQLLSEL